MKLKVLNSQTLSEFEELDLFLTIRREGECLIGRSPNSGLVLDSSDVSRLHGKFFLQNGDYYYCDLGSRNGSLINGKLAETNQKYVLKPGDVIRLGEFVLMLEEMASPDLAETVVRVIDVPVVSNSLQNQQIPPLPKQEEKVPEVAPQEVLKLSTPDSQQIGQQNTGQQNTIEESTPEAVDRQATPVSEELTYVQIDEHTYIQPQQSDSQQIGQHTMAEQASDVVNPQATPVSEELTYVQIDEYTFVQSAQVANEISENEIALGASRTRLIATSQPEQEVPVVADDVSKQITPESQQPIQPATEELAVEVVARQAERASEEPIDAQTDELTSLQPPEENQVPENAIALGASRTRLIATPQPEQEVPVVADNVPEQITPDSQPLEQPSTQEGSSVITQQATPISEAPNDVQTGEDTSIRPPEEENGVTESAIALGASRTRLIATPQLEQEVAVVTDDVSEQITLDSQQLEQPAIEEQAPEVVVQSPDVTEDITSSETPEFIDKYIVLIAHDSKRSQLAEIVAQHQKFFSKCLTLASSSISDLVAQQSDITISQQIPTATSGGYQTIASMVSSGDVLAVIFLRDLLMPQPGQANEEALLRLCNTNNLLVATNPSTAEAIVHYLETAKR